MSDLYVDKYVLPISEEDYAKLYGLPQRPTPPLTARAAAKFIARAAQNARPSLGGSDIYPPWTDNLDVGIKPPQELMGWRIRRRRPYQERGDVFAPPSQDRSEFLRSVTIGDVVYDILYRTTENEVKFDLWARSATEVEDLSAWFEAFVFTQAHSLALQGLSRCMYRETIVDPALDTLKYKIQMEHSSVVFAMYETMFYRSIKSTIKAILVKTEIE